MLYGEVLRPAAGMYGWLAGESAYLAIERRQRAAVAILAEARPPGSLDLDALAAEVLASVRGIRR
jgi:hypothetical protein